MNAHELSDRFAAWADNVGDEVLSRVDVGAVFRGINLNEDVIAELRKAVRTGAALGATLATKRMLTTGVLDADDIWRIAEETE